MGILLAREVLALRQQNGFSLLELLIVVAILSIVLISATSILDVGAITGNPVAEPTDWELATCRFNQNVVQNATEYFGIIHGRYPLQRISSGVLPPPRR